MVILQGEVSVDDVRRIEKYLINPVDSRLADLDVPESLKMEVSIPDDIPVQEGFINYNDEALSEYHKKMGLAMDFADIKFLQDYFKKINRDPTETEIKVSDAKKLASEINFVHVKGHNGNRYNEMVDKLAVQATQ